MAALCAADQANVTLVAPTARFSERVRWHELAAGRPDVTHPLAAFTTKKPVRHVAARATAMETLKIAFAPSLPLFFVPSRASIT